MKNEKRFMRDIEELRGVVSPQEEIVLIQLEYLALEEENESILKLSKEELKELVLEIMNYDLFSETDRMITTAVEELL